MGSRLVLLPTAGALPCLDLHIFSFHGAKKGTFPNFYKFFADFSLEEHYFPKFFVSLPLEHWLIVLMGQKAVKALLYSFWLQRKPAGATFEGKI